MNEPTPYITAESDVGPLGDTRSKHSHTSAATAMAGAITRPF